MNVLIHEAGHFFGLNHTFDTEGYMNSDGSGCTNLCACPRLVGGNDGIADTPLDHQCWTQDQVATNTLGVGRTYVTLTSSQQYFVDNTYSNIMSYHNSPPGTRFTPDQLDVMTDNSNGPRLNITSGRTRFVSTSGNDIVGNGSSGSRFRTLGRGISAANPGDIVLLRAGNYNEPQIFTKAVTLRATRGTAVIGKP